MAGELKADTDDSFNFSENINRSNRLNEIGKVKVHSLTDLEDLWLLHLTEIASSGEVKKINTNSIVLIMGAGNISEFVRSFVKD